MEHAAHNKKVYSRFIVFEGIDGSGTTTQSAMLVEAIGKQFKLVSSHQEPTKGAIGQLIRSCLAGHTKVTDGTMARLFAADRFEHVSAPETGLFARLASNEWVVCDRYVFSSMAYQGQDIGYPEVYAMNSSLPLPAWVFFLALPAERAMQRLQHRNSLDIYENTAFQQRVSQSYRKAFEYYRNSEINILELDAGLSPEIIHQQVCKSLGILPIK